MSRKRGRPPKKVSCSPETHTSSEGTTEAAIEGITVVTEELREFMVEDEEESEVDTVKSTPNPNLEVPKESEIDKTMKSDMKLWVDVIRGNRQTANGKVIQFVVSAIVDGVKEVEIEIEDMESEIRYWDTALIMYAIRGNLSMHPVKNYMRKMWSFVQFPEIFYNEEGYFILKFKTDEEREEVMMKGLYTIHNMHMVILEWRPDLSMARDMLRIVPIWVTLPQLPLHLWGERSLGKIGSVIGNPLYTDECTPSKLRVSYARILVEVHVTLFNLNCSK
ncbi:uncharacterized protein LOC131639859 [Vicia villosa]|uniref:uncharacterized protein LOC131639859 n=1 Tax=Vicia villosa TaxID=3911 RepID=UPI00273BFBFC|nr:uncharacterized protein LOC131639859 [Vicia villosa]